MLIIGVGLIGGSLALAGRAKGVVGEVTGMGRTERSLQRAREMGVIDRVALDLEEGLEGTDLVVLATPVGNFEEWGRALAQRSLEGITVTDVGSVKGNLVIRLEEILGHKTPFVGGHPIAGREKAGVEAAQVSLFEGARCILTPTPRTVPEALARVQALWEGVGTRVSLVDPFVHDRLLAAVSHLPHVVAYALVNTVMETEVAGHDILSFSGGGFRDFTRIAASSEEMWRDICLQNRDALVAMIEAYQQNLELLKQNILKGEGERLVEAFRRAKGVRDRIL
jgi:prephenate dehydrogenase